MPDSAGGRDNEARKALLVRQAPRVSGANRAPSGRRVKLGQ